MEEDDIGENLNLTQPQNDKEEHTQALQLSDNTPKPVNDSIIMDDLFPIEEEEEEQQDPDTPILLTRSISLTATPPTEKKADAVFVEEVVVQNKHSKRSSFDRAMELLPSHPSPPPPPSLTNTMASGDDSGAVDDGLLTPEPLENSVEELLDNTMDREEGVEEKDEEVGRGDEIGAASDEIVQGNFHRDDIHVNFNDNIGRMDYHVHNDDDDAEGAGFQFAEDDDVEPHDHDSNSAGPSSSVEEEGIADPPPSAPLMEKSEKTVRITLTGDSDDDKVVDSGDRDELLVDDNNHDASSRSDEEVTNSPPQEEGKKTAKIALTDNKEGEVHTEADANDHNGSSRLEEEHIVDSPQDKLHTEADVDEHSSSSRLDKLDTINSSSKEERGKTVRISLNGDEDEGTHSHDNFNENEAEDHVDDNDDLSRDKTNTEDVTPKKRKEKKKKKRGSSELVTPEIVRKKKGKRSKNIYATPGKGYPAGNRKYKSVAIEDMKDDEVGDGTVRRSKRKRFTPLQFWKNEKLIYEPHKEGGILGEAMGQMPVVKGVVTALPTPYKRRKAGKQVLIVKKKVNEGSMTKVSEKMTQFDSTKLRKKYHINDGEGVYTWDEDKGEIEEKNLIRYSENMKGTTLPQNTKRAKGESKVVGKASQAFNVPADESGTMPGWIGGNLSLPPRGIKDAEGVGLCSQVFNIGDSQPDSLEISIADPEENDGKYDASTAQRYLLSKGDMFYIPAGNIYRIENHSRTVDCTLYWTIIRPVRPT